MHKVFSNCRKVVSVYGISCAGYNSNKKKLLEHVMVNITPLLKKQSLEPDVLGNYRPISNLSFISKILEKVVAKRLSSHKTSESLYEPFQSTYHAGHSTGDSSCSNTEQYPGSLFSGKCVFLVRLDLSAAFDTVSHDILLDRLLTRFWHLWLCFVMDIIISHQSNAVSACFWEVF